MVNRVLIQTEIDYKIKKRIIHLDENYFWIMKKKTKKNRNQSVNINTEFFRFSPAIEHVLLEHENAKRKKVN